MTTLLGKSFSNAQPEQPKLQLWLLPLLHPLDLLRGVQLCNLDSSHPRCKLELDVPLTSILPG